MQPEAAAAQHIGSFAEAGDRIKYRLFGQGGVAMAEAALAQTQRPEVVRLATAIVQAQQGEITYMTQLLAKRGAKPLPPLAPMEH